MDKWSVLLSSGWLSRLLARYHDISCHDVMSRVVPAGVRLGPQERSGDPSRRADVYSKPIEVTIASTPATSPAALSTFCPEVNIKRSPSMSTDQMVIRP